MVCKRKIDDFLDMDKLVDVSLSVLSWVGADEFICCGLVFILPSVTIWSTLGDKKDFYKKVNEEYFLWHRQLKRRIGNRGLRVIKKDLSNSKIRVLLSGIWVISGKICLGEMLEIKRMLDI